VSNRSMMATVSSSFALFANARIAAARLRQCFGSSIFRHSMLRCAPVARDREAQLISPP
jgi:hypothetical protein